MSEERDPAELRRELADRVTTKLSPDLCRVSPYFGEQYASSNAPEARAIRERNGTFRWVAFGFDPHPMWDAHIGVLTTDSQVMVGIHVHERVSLTQPKAVAAIADEIGAEYRFSETAAEHQFNYSPVPLNTVDIDNLAEKIAELCRKFESVVDELKT